MVLLIDRNCSRPIRFNHCVVCFVNIIKPSLTPSHGCHCHHLMGVIALIYCIELLVALSSDSHVKAVLAASLCTLPDIRHLSHLSHLAHNFHSCPFLRLNTSSPHPEIYSTLHSPPSIPRSTPPFIHHPPSLSPQHPHAHILLYLPNYRFLYSHLN